MIERIRGVNFGGWFSQIDAIEEKDPKIFPGNLRHMESFLGPEDFKRVKAWGFDHVRLPVDYFNVFEGPDLNPNEQVLGLLDQAIDGIIGAGLRVIFDLHKCPGHDFHSGTSEEQKFFSDPATREDAKKVWTHLAGRYGHHPEMLLEILNEPVAPDAETWNVVGAEMAAHIRAHAPKATILMGSNRWNNAAQFEHLTPIDDDNIVYSFHYYLPLLFTHQKAPWINGDHFRVSRSYPGDYSIPEGTESRLPLEIGHWDRNTMEKSLEHVIAFREQHGVPVACNEFGVYVGGAKREHHLTWMRDFLSILSDHGIGWSYWNYKNLDFGLISRNESLFENYPQYDNPERVDQEMVALLQTL